MSSQGEVCGYDSEREICSEQATGARPPGSIRKAGARVRRDTGRNRGGARRVRSYPERITQAAGQVTTAPGKAPRSRSEAGVTPHDSDDEHTVVAFSGGVQLVECLHGRCDCGVKADADVCP